MDVLFSTWEKVKKKKKRKKLPGDFIPGPEAGHILLAVPGRIF
jgi:hypothetical protein